MPSTSSTNPFSTRLSLCISLQLFFKSVDMDGRFAFCKTKLYYILSCHVMFKINLSWCMWKTLSCFLWSAQDINLNTWETWASTSILGRLGHQPQYLGDLDTNLNTWEDWTSTSILGRPGHQPQYLGDLDTNLNTWEDWTSTSILGRPGHQPQYLGDLDTNLNTWETWTSTSVHGSPMINTDITETCCHRGFVWNSKVLYRHIPSIRKLRGRQGTTTISLRIYMWQERQGLPYQNKHYSHSNCCKENGK